MAAPFPRMADVHKTGEKDYKSKKALKDGDGTG